MSDTGPRVRRVVDVLNLGAGVGSSTLFMMMHRGDLPGVDAAIFADTQEEPTPVYEHLQWLISLGSPRVLVGTRGKLGDSLIRGVNAAGQGGKSGKRFASIPAYTATLLEDGSASEAGCERGKVKRQCTSEYKVQVVEQVIRRELLGLKPRQRRPKGVHVRQHFGLSDDEGVRIRKVRERFAKNGRGEPVFPLARLGMTRDDCVAYLRQCVPHEVPRSACTFCPFRSAEEWVWLRDNDPAGFARAVEIDRAIRDEQSVCTRGMRQALFLHRSCQPLESLDLDAMAAEERKCRAGRERSLFPLLDADCVAGMCGV